MNAQEQEYVAKIVDEVKSQGLFDQLRRKCLATVDDQVDYRLLKFRVDKYCEDFLSHQRWQPRLNKTELRDRLREKLMKEQFVNKGIKDLVDCLVRINHVEKDLKPAVERIVYKHLGLPIPPGLDDGPAELESNNTIDEMVAVRRSESSEHDESDTAATSRIPRLDLPEADDASSNDGMKLDESKTVETPVQDESGFPPIDPSPSIEPLELDTSGELSVRCHVTEISPNPAADESTDHIEVIPDEIINDQQIHALVFGTNPIDIESPAHESI